MPSTWRYLTTTPSVLSHGHVFTAPWKQVAGDGPYIQGKFFYKKRTNTEKI